VFIIPLMFIRFIEIPRAAILAAGIGPSAKRAPALPSGALVVAQPGQGDLLGVPFVEAPDDDEAPPEEEDPYADLEPDEELLRRIREA
jgi:hypothetical protein